MTYAELYGWVELHLLLDLSGWSDCVLQMAEEHLHRLHVVFDHLREYNLKLKPSKCSLFKEEINYLAHQVSKWGVWPSNTNIKAITEYAPPQTYTEIRAFLGLMGHYRRFIKGFAQNCPTTKWALGWRGSQQEVRMSVPIWRGSWGIWSIKTSLHEQSSVSFCQLYQRLPTWNRCLQGGIGSSSFPETGRWTVSPGSLWQLGAHHTWEELSFH